jgi:hypothetical protein
METILVLLYCELALVLWPGMLEAISKTFSKACLVCESNCRTVLEFLTSFALCFVFGVAGMTFSRLLFSGRCQLLRAMGLGKILGLEEQLLWENGIHDQVGRVNSVRSRFSHQPSRDANSNRCPTSLQRRRQKQIQKRNQRNV